MRDQHRIHTYNVKYLLILLINSSRIHELTNDIVLILSATVMYGTVHTHLLRVKLHVDLVGIFGRRFVLICERTMFS
jgi:hypothetical protein